jgi:hypothetical protein
LPPAVLFVFPVWVDRDPESDIKTLKPMSCSVS